MSALDGVTLDFSVVILTAGVDTGLLRRCLTSVLIAAAGAAQRWEIFLLDNASQSLVGEVIAHEFPNVNVVRFADRVGFCTANNYAFERSRGKYIVQLNDDTQLATDALAKIIRFLDDHPKAGAVGPRLENVCGELQVGYHARRLPTIWNTLFHLLGINKLWPLNPINRKHLLLDEIDETRRVEQPAGAALTYRREALFRIGLLDDDFTFAFDDVDICRRLLNAGWEIWYNRDAHVTHLGAASLGDQPGLNSYTINGILCYWAKHGSRFEFFTVRIALLFALALRSLASTVSRAAVRHECSPTSHHPYFFKKVLESFVGSYVPQTLARLSPETVQRGTSGVARA